VPFLLEMESNLDRLLVYSDVVEFAGPVVPLGPQL
jgi:hypothetical protein